jgi:hypothetical protein
MPTFWIALRAVKLDDNALAATEDLSPSFLFCRLYEKAQPLFSTPCDSRIMGIFVVQKRNSTIVKVERDKLKTQAIMVKEHGPGCHCFIAILHNV